MRVLWICNMILPAIAKGMGIPYSEREGWLTGIYEQVVCNGRGDIELGICYPSWGQRVEKSSLHGIMCYGFPENLHAPERYDVKLEEYFAWILEDFKPDMLHIFGTEYPHALAAVTAYGKPARTLVGIQGLCYRIAQVYGEGLPERVVKRSTFRDKIRKDSIQEQIEKFRVRGEHEKKVIRSVGHITGRTDFDRKGTLSLNPALVYHPMNETMRGCFYQDRWREENCIKHSIFLSQGDYPIKGFHYMLMALPALRRKYSDVHVYVAGNSIISHKTWRERLKLSSYGKYLLELIKEYGLEECITALGTLGAGEMKERYLKSHVFVCPSILENSPNALFEAMLLGMPAVAASTGGIPSLLENDKEGILYRPGDVRGLAEGIEKAFESGAAYSEPARKRAHITCDGETNFKRLCSIYREICEEGKT